MEKCGKLQEMIPASHTKADEFLMKALQQHSVDACHIEEPHEVEEAKEMVANCSSYNKEERTSLTSASARGPELAHDNNDEDNDEPGSIKRQRVENEVERSSAFEVTESSILNLLQEFDNGVSEKNTLIVDKMKLVCTFFSFAYGNI